MQAWPDARQFTEYWLKVHAPLALKAPDPFSVYVLAFVRHLPQDAPPDMVIGMSASYSPSPEARASTLASPEARAMQADQSVFVDRSRTSPPASMSSCRVCPATAPTSMC